MFYCPFGFSICIIYPQEIQFRNPVWLQEVPKVDNDNWQKQSINIFRLLKNNIE